MGNWSTLTLKPRPVAGGIGGAEDQTRKMGRRLKQSTRSVPRGARRGPHAGQPHSHCLGLGSPPVVAPGATRPNPAPLVPRASERRSAGAQNAPCLDRDSSTPGRKCAPSSRLRILWWETPRFPHKLPLPLSRCFSFPGASFVPEGYGNLVHPTRLRAPGSLCDFQGRGPPGLWLALWQVRAQGTTTKGKQLV